MNFTSALWNQLAKRAGSIPESTPAGDVNAAVCDQLEEGTAAVMNALTVAKMEL